MIGLLLTGGDGPDLERLRALMANVDLVVAADAGVERAIELGIEPDLIVGDMDSITDPDVLKRFPNEKIMRFPQEKDETDTEIGLSVLRERGCQKVTIAGGGGGRLAHTMGILALFRRHPAPDLWVTSQEVIQRLEGNFELADCMGETLSFFPLGPVRIGRSEGLQWPLGGFRWDDGDVGISNVAISSRVLIQVNQGALLMVREISEKSVG